MTAVLPPHEAALLASVFDTLLQTEDWRIKPADILSEWERTVSKCEGVYDLGLDEYTDELTVRELIKKLLELDRDRQLVEFRHQLQKLDCRFLAATRPVDRTLLHHDYVANETAEYFFYYRIPCRFGDEFTEDLARQGFTTASGD